MEAEKLEVNCGLEVSQKLKSQGQSDEDGTIEFSHKEVFGGLSQKQFL